MPKHETEAKYSHNLQLSYLLEYFTYSKTEKEVNTIFRGISAELAKEKNLAMVCTKFIRELLICKKSGLGKVRGSISKGAEKAINSVIDIYNTGIKDEEIHSISLENSASNILSCFTSFEINIAKEVVLTKGGNLNIFTVASTATLIKSHDEPKAEACSLQAAIMALSTLAIMASALKSESDKGDDIGLALQSIASQAAFCADPTLENIGDIRDNHLKIFMKFLQLEKGLINSKNIITPTQQSSTIH